MACECIAEMDARLAERNTKITCGIVFTRPEAYAVPVIGVEKLNPRKRDRVSVVPTFCPFCGIAYRPDEAHAPAARAAEADRG